MKVEGWASISKLGHLQEASKKSIWEMMSVTKESLHEEPYTKEEVRQLLELATDKELEDLVGMRDESVKSLTEFELFKRAYHVYSEAKRVYDFKMVCDRAAAAEAGKSRT